LIFAAGAVTLTGADASHFAIASDTCSGESVASSASCDVEVTFSPASTGAKTATLRFADDSVATISYLTDGSPRFAKETLDVLGDGRVGRLDNFQRVTVWTSKGKNGRRVFAGQDKGHAAQLKRFIEAVRTDAAMPIALESLVATTRATLAVGTSLATSKPVTL